MTITSGIIQASGTDCKETCSEAYTSAYNKAGDLMIANESAWRNIQKANCETAPPQE